MKKIFLMFAVALSVMLTACGGGKSGDREKGISLNEVAQEDSVAKVEKEAKADYNSMTTEEKKEAILAVLNELVFYDNHNDSTYERCCTQNLRNMLEQGYGICGYADSDPEIPAEPVKGGVKITKFNPETGEVTYTVDVKWEDHYDNTSGVRVVEEQATFKVEDGEIKMDTNSGMQFYS